MSTPPQVHLSRVVVSDIDMSIGSMCRFMVRWAIAAIPAMLILATSVWVVGLVFGLLFRALSGVLRL